MRTSIKIILASASPRRREFLRQIGWPFEIIVPRVEETLRSRESPAHFALRLAREKARWVAEKGKKRTARLLIIAADTIVVKGRHILQKPRNAADAARMLRLLSGKPHEVISGLCVLAADRGRLLKEKTTVSRTKVVFKKLTDQEIRFYVASGEPMDKAGAYAVQGIGSFLVRALRGSYTNVVGLPLSELMAILEKDFGLTLTGSGNRAGRSGGRTAGTR